MLPLRNWLEIETFNALEVSPLREYESICIDSPDCTCYRLDHWLLVFHKQSSLYPSACYLCKRS
jgi:hypothetical protein